MCWYTWHWRRIWVYLNILYVLNLACHVCLSYWPASIGIRFPVSNAKCSQIIIRCWNYRQTRDNATSHIVNPSSKRQRISFRAVNHCFSFWQDDSIGLSTCTMHQKGSAKVVSTPLNTIHNNYLPEEIWQHSPKKGIPELCRWILTTSSNIHHIVLA